MKRAVVATLAIAAIAAPLSAQTARDNVVEQGIADTIRIDLQRRGIAGTDPRVQTLIDQMYAKIATAKAAGALASETPTWAHVMRWLISSGNYPAPWNVGKDGASFGGAGAGGTWTSEDCGDVDYELDPAGNLVFPSFVLKTGAKIVMTGSQFGGGAPFWHGDNGSQWQTNTSAPQRYSAAVDYQALARRQVHLINMKRLPKDWYGVIGPNLVGTTQCVDMATVAYRNTSGTITPRVRNNMCFNLNTSPGHNPTVAGPYEIAHKNCPQDDFDSADIHFYGESDLQSHWHQCTMFIPNEEFGWKGYAINTKTTLAYVDSARWPIMLPEHVKDCPIDPELLKKITDGLYKDIAAPAVPYQPIDPTSPRPGDLKVRDLEDNPGTGTSPTPGPNVNDPPPTTTTPTTPTAPSGGTDVCDFGTGGCDNPNTPDPTLEAVPEGILDPIFDWLPDLPSITINTAGAQCPTWPLDLTAFGGPSWQFVMEDHCPLLEDQRAAISVLMIVLFGLGAAAIILRA
jgi:hypothetical protein